MGVKLCGRRVDSKYCMRDCVKKLARVVLLILGWINVSSAMEESQ